MFAAYNIIQVEAMKSWDNSYAMSVAEIGLIVLSCIVFFGTLLGITALCIAKKKYVQTASCT